ncbi:MAG TPA: hypothetical protein VGD01_08860 [Candidatus Elarobacter sp.]|jgi:hypothetical protein
MIAHRTQPEADLDLESARRVLRRANAYVLASLPALVDVRTLREGDFEDDYFVEVPCRRLPEVGDRLAHLKFIATERFDVGFSIMSIAT